MHRHLFVFILLLFFKTLHCEESDFSIRDDPNVVMSGDGKSCIIYDGVYGVNEYTGCSNEAMAKLPLPPRTRWCRCLGVQDGTIVFMFGSTKIDIDAENAKLGIVSSRRRWRRRHWIFQPKVTTATDKRWRHNSSTKTRRRLHGLYYHTETSEDITTIHIL